MELERQTEISCVSCSFCEGLLKKKDGAYYDCIIFQDVPIGVKCFALGELKKASNIFLYTLEEIN